MELFGDLVEQYREFASDAVEESPCFVEWSLAVAADADVQAWLADLPRIKQQPNLVFAAARWHGAPAPGPYDGFRRVLLGDDGAVRQTILARSTQTNEVGRLASLTPLFARLPGPLALLEAGTSAGLCLYPDRYDYAWPPLGELGGSGGPVLTCSVEGDPPLPPLPSRHPEVAWRGGVDLHPLDVTDADAMAWLATLVWPEQDERRAALRAAVEVTRADPPRIVAGDLLDELPALVDEAGRHGTPVVFHSAVIAYLDSDGRRSFGEMMRSLVADGRCRWVSNEAPGVVPGIDGPRLPARFVLALDGRPVASAQGHGRALTWF
jgi:hypothetical protein